MKRKCLKGHQGLLLFTAMLAFGIIPHTATALTDQQVRDMVRADGIPDIAGAPNWAYSPRLPKFTDTLPGLCGPYPTAIAADGTRTNANLAQINNLGQCLPIAEPDITTYPGSDYYEIEIVQYREQLHGGLPPLANSGGTPYALGDITAAVKKDPTTQGGTLLRGYVQNQAGVTGPAATPHYGGPLIVGAKDRPVRIKFTNKLPTGPAGDHIIPTDTTVMGSGPGPDYIRTNINADAETCQTTPSLCYTQNRADIHLHGGRTPWISDGTAHQWITPAGEPTNYKKGVSVSYVPDMWYTSGGVTITECAGKTSCSVTGATNNPGDGSQTYYYTNAQSARLMFYHEHAWGTTRLGVYVGAVAPYLLIDSTEASLVNAGLIPDAAHTIPLVIQDKTFVDAATIVDNASTVGVANDGTDPTWIWGSKPGTMRGGYNPTGAVPVTGDLWWPHVYVPAQNPFNPDLTGINPFGRWHYGPWFWPPTVVSNGPVANPYWDGDAGEQSTKLINPEPPQVPGTPTVSWGAEAFLDTPVVNGTAYPTLEVTADQPYRFRILNGAHDRFWNLQFYVAESDTRPGEVAMIPAVPATAGVANNGGFDWPADGRAGGVPDPAKRGPAMVQIGSEGGFLPAPVVLPNRPVNWNTDPTTFTAGLVYQQNQGGGTLMLGPAERADVIVDFSAFAGKTLILYNDAPAPWPALDPHYDYYTDGPDNREMGGADTTLAGFGPNTRTIMKIKVGAGTDFTPGVINAVPVNLEALQAAFKPVSTGNPTGLGIFKNGQEPIIVGQSAYNETYSKTFPATWPNWGLSRITDNAISFMNPDGAIVSNYYMEPKAIQDEMGEVFDEFGRMSAKLGLEVVRTTAGIQTFMLQNFVDPATELVKKDQIQIWKITHNGVDTHPVHFHLFEIQLLNRVGWDGFIYLPDANELGWKDTIRVNPLQDTIVALRPAKIPTPFTVPNSRRPLNPAMPPNSEVGFTTIDPVTGLPRTVTNETINFGHEYLWHCHILSHEEQDMMRPIILNANSLLYTLDANGFWQWDSGKWISIFGSNPGNVVSYGSFAYGDRGANGLWEWNGYTWKKISSNDALSMVTSEAGLFVSFSNGLYKWKDNTWTRINANIPSSMVASGSGLFAAFNVSGTVGLYQWDGKIWKKITSDLPARMASSGKMLYANISGKGLHQWDGATWKKISNDLPDSMVASGSMLYTSITGKGLYQWDGSFWKRINDKIPPSMSASGSTLYANFSALGLYEWNGITWKKIHAIIPNNMIASGSVLYANFGGVNGVQKWEFGKWTSLFNATTVLSMSPGY